MVKLANDSYPIVISDVYLDERTGLDILKAAKSSNPECSVILMSGRGFNGDGDGSHAPRRVRLQSPSLLNWTKYWRW